MTPAELLTFEKQHRKHGGFKEEQIRARFNIPPARYYQLLDAMIDSREGIQFDPVLCRQLRDQRDRAETLRRHRHAA